MKIESYKLTHNVVEVTENNLIKSQLHEIAPELNEQIIRNIRIILREELERYFNEDN